MSAETERKLLVDCGRLTGHQQRELEIPKDATPFFGILSINSHALYLGVSLSNGQREFLRMIYRQNNGMWRVELTTQVPEIDNLIPSGDKRSDHAAIFEKTGDADSSEYQLTFEQIDSDKYKAIWDSLANQHRTQDGPSGRNYGWS